MTRTHSRGGGRTRASLALSLAASLLLGGALAANASSDNPIVDATETGTIHIFKYKKTDAGAAHDGSYLDPAPGNDALTGVQFKIQKINGELPSGNEFSLTTDESWQKVQEIAATFDPNNFDPADYYTTLATGQGLTAGISAATGSDGQTTISQLPLGLYYVTEVSNNVNGMAPGESRVPIVPFLVTVPMSVTSSDLSTQATTWSYELWLYPKNDVIKVDKTITPGTDGGLTAGQRIEYNLSVDLPAIDPNVPPVGTTAGVTHGLSTLVFTDVLDERLDYLTTPAPVVAYTDGTTTTPLVTGDYELTTVPTAGTHGGKLVVTVTQAGLDKLTAIAQDPSYMSGDLQVVMTFSAVANTESEPQDPITNGGITDPDDPNNNTSVDIEVDHVPNDPIIPPEVGDKTEYGGISLWKYGYDLTTQGDIDDSITNGSGLPSGSALAGAEFMVFASFAQAQAYAADSAAALPEVCFYNGVADSSFSDRDTCEAGDGADNHGVWVTAPVQFYDVPGIVPVGGYTNETPTDVAISDANGKAVIGGLKYGTYYVLETKAPVGYSLLAQPLEITIEMALDDGYFGNSNSTDPVDDQVVPNVPANAGFPIPLTGGSGVLVFTLLALGIAVVTIVVLRKQKHAVA